MHSQADPSVAAVSTSGSMKLLPRPPKNVRVNADDSLGHGMDAVIMMAIFLGAGNFLAELFREFAGYGGNVDADLLEYLALHQPARATARILVAFFLALPAVVLERSIAARLALDALEERPGGRAETVDKRLLDLIERMRRDCVLKRLELLDVNLRKEAAHDGQNLAEFNVDPAELEDIGEKPSGVPFVDPRLAPLQPSRDCRVFTAGVGVYFPPPENLE